VTLNDLAQQINDNARAHGFWDGERNFGEMIALTHSELSEALEEHRSGKPAEYLSHQHCPPNDRVTDTCKPAGVAVELADCIIRCLDMMHSLGVDIDAVVARKMVYNASRPFKHGRAY
jgi:NTP pyrophosphatase (non-canonical NTP hydrolase)